MTTVKWVVLLCLLFSSHRTPAHARWSKELTPKSPTGKGRMPGDQVDIKFGFRSINDRYTKSNGGVGRCLDPFNLKVLDLKAPLLYENWLLRRFDRGVTSVEANPSGWTALHQGELVVVKPHLHWIGTDGRGRLELVATRGCEVSPKAARALVTVCRAHRLDPSLRVEAAVRRDPSHIQRLDLIRQELALNLHLLECQQPLHAVETKLLNHSFLRVVDVVGLLASMGWHLSDLTATAVLFYWRQLGRIDLADQAGRITAVTHVELGWFHPQWRGLPSSLMR